MSATAFQRMRREVNASLEKLQQEEVVEPDQDNVDDGQGAKDGQQNGKQDDQKEDGQDGQQESQSQGEGQEDEQKEENVEIPTLEKLTNDQLKALLEERGIEYKKSATKAELIDLLQGTDN